MDTGEYPGSFTRATIVAMIAMTMPRMPYALPFFEVSNLDRPARAKMNSRPEMMKEALTKFTNDPAIGAMRSVDVMDQAFLNILSMRWVTVKPPKMLMPLMALVTLISGVWRAWVTFHTT